MVRTDILSADWVHAGWTEILRRHLKLHEAVSVSKAAVVARPFCTLRAIVRERPGGPAVLIVTPFSGQQVATFGDLMDAPAPDHEVYVTEWEPWPA